MVGADAILYVAIACGEHRKVEDRVMCFASNSPVPSFSEVRSSVSAKPATDFAQAIIDDLSTIPEVLNVRVGRNNDETQVWILVDEPSRQARYRIYDRQASLMAAFSSVDINFMLVHAE